MTAEQVVWQRWLESDRIRPLAPIFARQFPSVVTVFAETRWINAADARHAVSSWSALLT
jgi:hypothetical protein